MKSVNNPVVAIQCAGNCKEEAIKCKFTQVVTYDETTGVTMILVKTEIIRSDAKQKQICREVLKAYSKIGIKASKVSYHLQGADIYQLQPN